MNVGDKVKVRVGKSWRCGTVEGFKYLENNDRLITVAIGEPHYFNYEVRDFSSSDVKRHEFITENKDEENILLLPVVLEETNVALAFLLPGTQAVIKDGAIWAYDVTLEPCVYEQETIGAFREIAGWSVTFWRHFQATRYDPEDVSDSHIGSFPNYTQAIQKFIETTFLCKSNDYWQCKADEEMCSMWGGDEEM